LETIPIQNMNRKKFEANMMVDISLFVILYEMIAVIIVIMTIPMMSVIVYVKEFCMCVEL